MTGLRALRSAIGFAALFTLSSALSSAPASATCYEVGLEIKNGGSYVSIPISVIDPNGTVVFSGTSTNVPDSQGANFTMDLNHNCPGIPDLTPGTRYTIVFGTWGATYFVGSLGGTNDAWYQVTPSAITFVSGQAGLESFTGYPCAMSGLTLAISSTQHVGDKTIFTLKATALGALAGSCSALTFSWTNVSAQISGVHANPNYAQRTMLRNDSEVVTATVTDSFGVHFTKSITLDTGL